MTSKIPSSCDGAGDLKSSCKKGGFPDFAPNNSAVSSNSHSDHHDNTEDTSIHKETPPQDYLDQLIMDKNQLKLSQGGPQFKHLVRLIDMEINRVMSTISNTTSSAHSNDGESGQGQKIILTEKIYVPVDKYPRYNFVGRILGPRGMTAKQLEEETGCKIMVRGRGAMRQEPLHVLVQCEDFESRCHQKLKDACDKVNALLHPPPEGKDELKRKQLIELSIINGTYRPTSATKLALQTPRAMTGFQQNEQFMHRSPQDSRAVLSSILEQGNNNNKISSRSKTDEDLENYSKLLSFMSNPMSMNPLFNPALPTNDMFKHILNMSLTDPNMLASLFSSASISGNDPFLMNMNMQQNLQSSFNNQCAPIPQATLQQYLQAAAMLNAMPFAHDGSGDAPKPKRN